MSRRARVCRVTRERRRAIRDRASASSPMIDIEMRVSKESPLHRTARKSGWSRSTKLTDASRKLVEAYFLAFTHRRYGVAGDPERGTAARRVLVEFQGATPQGGTSTRLPDRGRDLLSLVYPLSPAGSSPAALRSRSRRSRICSSCRLSSSCSERVSVRRTSTRSSFQVDSRIRASSAASGADSSNCMVVLP